MPTGRRGKELRPIRRDTDLRCLQAHGAGAHLVGEIVLNQVLLLEVTVVQRDARGRTSSSRRTGKVQG